MAQIAVFDLDGVIIKSPSRESVSEVSFWENFWTDISCHEANPEILALMKILCAADIQVFILTARPNSFEGVTLQSLALVCSIHPRICSDPVEHQMDETGYHLMMRDGENVFHDFQSNSIWKRLVINLLMVNHDVLFAMDDYKPNIEEIRKVVPSFLYEELRY